jgi:NADPH:quinone reductase-like Zn-dependent oxidoreductase
LRGGLANQKSGFWRSLRSLQRGGYYILVAGLGLDWFIAGVLGSLVGGMWASVTGAAKVVGTSKRGDTIERLSFLKELIEAGKLRTVIEKRYSLDEIAEAHRHAEAGHKKGHLLIVFE